MHDDFYESYEVTKAQQTSAFVIFMRNVYLWMTFAFITTGLTAAYVASSPTLMQIFSGNVTCWILALFEVCIVWYLSSRITLLSFPTASILYVLFSILNGLTLNSIFLEYTMESIETTFYITAGTFGVMTLVGYFTKNDLSTKRSFLIMALIGLIIATIVNIFLQSTQMMWLITYAGILIFCGFTIYDTQKIKTMFLVMDGDKSETKLKAALIVSLALYLVFINLLYYLLRIFKCRRT